MHSVQCTMHSEGVAYGHDLKSFSEGKYHNYALCTMHCERQLAKLEVIGQRKTGRPQTQPAGYYYNMYYSAE